jgi:hypothetical protein
MFIQIGCISGWKYESSPVVNCNLQGVAVTLRNSTTSSINAFNPLGNKESELPSVGDTARSSAPFPINNINDLLLAASVNAYDNGPVLTAQYQVPIAFTGWANHGVASSIGKRLGVATNGVLTNYPIPEQVDFQQNFSGEDSLTTVIRYHANTGNILAVGNGTQVLVAAGTSITIPLYVSSLEGDTVIISLMHELNVTPPVGLILDYTDTILGNVTGLTDLERQTKLSLYRKVLTATDISNGSFTFETQGG